jgi:putative endonuclease
MYDWHLYLIRTRHDTLYTGIATDVARRLVEHKEVGGSGAKYLRSKGPLHLAYQTKIGSRALALKVEHRVKKLPKQKKEQIVSARPSAEDLLAMLGIRPRA